MRRSSRCQRVCQTITALAFLAAQAAATTETADLASELEEEIDQLFEPWNRSDAPGAAIAVIRDGKMVYENAFGMADLERGVALTPHSAFEIGSISKQFTAMCILLLEHDGALSLDDDVRKYVAEMPVYESPITLRQLLHHTSGVRDIETLIPLAGMPYVNYYSDAQLLELITRQKELNFPPGSEFLYSNSGYLLLAKAVERVSGQTLREFAQQRIFGPLGMRHTVFWDDPTQIVRNRALAYSTDEAGRHGMDMWNMPFDGPAGLYTTVGDLALWDANFYDNKLGGEGALIERMEETGTLVNGESTRYAAGLVITTHRDLPLIAHGGAWMGYRASMIRFPEEHLSVILLANSASIDVSVQSIADLYLGEARPVDDESPTLPEPPSTIELSPKRLAKYAGTYWNEDQRLLRKIEVRDGNLSYVRGTDSVTGADNATELGAVEKNGHFVMIGLASRVDVEFSAKAGDQGRTMTVSVEEQEPLLFSPVLSLPGKELTAYVGHYWSEELDRELRISLQSGRLRIAWADDPQPSPVEIISPDRLWVQQFVPVPWSPQDVELQIQRKGSDQVTGFRLSCEMVRGITFKRLTQ